MLNRDSYNNIEDFLADQHFLNWVKYDDTSFDWESWASDDSQRLKLLEEAKLFVLAMKFEYEEISQEEVQVALKQTWKKIRDTKKDKSVALKSSGWFKYAAAIAAVILSFSAFLYLKQLNNKGVSYEQLIDQDENGLIEQANNSNIPQLITLSDASSILLQPKSKISYPKVFSGNERRVYLSGEGFFEISKDQKKPFYVYANEVITRVYGTSFRITAYENRPVVDVIVKTGKVKVSSNNIIEENSSKHLMLLPNQAARFTRSNLSFKKIKDVNKDDLILASQKSIEMLDFEFKNVVVSKIFQTIEEAYSVTIDFPTEKLKDCYLTTSLNDEPLPEKLNIVCKSLGSNTSYIMNGNHIKILSDGCE